MKSKSHLPNHISFWLGVFCALLITVPIVLGTMYTLRTAAIDYAAFLFGALIAIVFCLIFVICLRDFILRKLFDVAAVGSSELIDTLTKLLNGIIDQDKKEIEENATNISKKLLSWYSWNNFYKWVIGTGVALLGTFAIFAGTILLVEQNNQLRKANTNSDTQSRQAMTIQLLMLADNNQAFKDDRKLLSKDIRKMFGERYDRTDLEIARKHVLNYFETLAVAANKGLLDEEVISENTGGSMIRVLDYSRHMGFLKESRCASGKPSTRKRMEHFEKFVECYVRPNYQKKIVDREVCKKRIDEKIFSKGYCPTKK